MVLGLKTKNKKRGSVQVDYLINLQEIRPWPPSQSLVSVHSVLLQWENGDLNSGSLASSVGGGKIEFNERFRISVTLYGEASKKGIANDSFQKNYLEIYLYETGKEKRVKGQLLGSAVINLADYGIIKEGIAISAPINFKKSSRNVAQPNFYLVIEPFYKDNSSAALNSSLLKEVSLDKDGSETFSELTNEGNDEECEIASFTDDEVDDVSSHSSRTISSSTFEITGVSPAQNYKNKTYSVKDVTRRVNRYPALSSLLVPAKEEVGTDTDQVSLEDSLINLEDARITGRRGKNGLDVVGAGSSNIGILEYKEKKDQDGNGQDKQNFEVKKNSFDDKLGIKFPEGTSKREIKLRSNTLAHSRTSPEAQRGIATGDKLKHVKSQLHFESAKSNRRLSSSEFMGKEKKNDISKDVYKAGMTNAHNGWEETTKGLSTRNVGLEFKIEMLQDELREAAALEVGLYSVVAEHGSSTSKVHTPARRLSRFYFHACRAMSKAKRASAARTAISGLVLVSKACGNDVPRLTFWLSNTVLLRAIVSHAIGGMQLSDGPSTNNGDKKGLAERFTPKRQESISEIEKNNVIGESDDWENLQTFIVALEKLEAWIFSRIVESVWWQTLTPHMQSAAVKGSSSRKASGRRNGLGDQEQGNFSIELWKKAFKDACERLCPVQAGGHECGCLPVLAKLVMEQLVGRLDVAMFNAILRESAEEMPTDPVSDPISDPKVLPIPAGKSSFGAGAQLKNAIGNWSRWLTDLFGIDDNDPLEDVNEVCDEKAIERYTSFKPFQLLNALSDLMMLPCEMLADNYTRKEVCPTFGAPLIKRVLNNFVPDEFNPDPISPSVFEALDSEGPCEDEEGSLTSFPCMATPTVYSPAPAASLSGIVGEVGNQALQRSGSAVLRKSYTSDDELDELDSSITSIIADNSHPSPLSAAPNWMPKGQGGRKVIRYKLLREVWKDGEQ
ncbi:hypothetical protein CICLE_v10030641mg [Citrus x clementina]|uniref:C2 NT-type domain-containing protein n=2 Tax=Citrus TaxID=2706 RepID=V4TNB3_CITCL|nr:uncharacterized protein LOC18045247 isoform X1 [Citrus x clementina]ESR51321.1 hypothetical protein CICLE_v10030641mg [Citrus x clementina]